MSANSESHFGGIALTVLLHLTVAGFAVAKNDGMQGCGTQHGDLTKYEDVEVVEASLAFKKKTNDKKQPQKRKKQKFKPSDEPGASRDEDLEKKAEEKPEKDRTKVNPDEVDINSILEKNRKQEEELSDFGSDEEIEQEGAEDGSEEFGTAASAEGDPYWGMVKGFLYNNWEVPTLEKGKGKAIGCITLNAKGKITETGFKEPSKNINIDRSVKLALKNSEDMTVPEAPPARIIKSNSEVQQCFYFEVP